MSLWRIHFNTLGVLLFLVLVFLRANQAQTYKVGTASPEKPQSDSNPTAPQKSLGWGSNIQNARLARAAESALKSGNYSTAVEYAQRAAETAPNDAQLWFLLGYAARLAGKMQLSLDAFNRGLRVNPSSLEGRSGLAQTYARMGGRDEAERLLTEVISADPQRINDVAVLGEMRLQSGQYDRALSVLGRAEQIQPSARTELLMALCYEHLNQFDAANHYLELARRRAPNNPDVQRSLAGFYRETGNHRAAITVLKAIRNPSPDVTAELAYTYQLYGKPDEAARWYAQAANAAPGDLSLQLSAAQAEVTTGSVEQAEPFLKRAGVLDSEHYRLHAVRGEIARVEEQKEAAVREYTAALARLPQAPAEGPLYGIQLHMNLVELYKNLQDESAANQHLQIAQSEIHKLDDDHGPTRPDFLRLRALIKMNAGDMGGAVSDIKEALELNAKDVKNLQLDGDLLARLHHPEQALAVYRKILAIDPTNRLALTSFGYLLRESGRDQEAEKYFQRLASAYPKSYVPYLALGDLYTSRRDFTNAEISYRKAYDIAPSNSSIIAGAMNAAIEAKHFPLAAQWLGRATPEMQQQPYVMRERERYLRWIGEYEQSAEVGKEAIKKLPRDRDVVVYLGYDLLHLDRYDELLQLTSRYDELLPQEPDIPLLAGYVHKHSGLFEQAQADFTRTLNRDPNIVTAYVNRGYVLNDLHRPGAAASDFESALRREPKNGEAHLGLAYASLNLQRPRVALRHVRLAEEQLGDSMAIHLIRGTAYGQQGTLTKAAEEYRAALKYSPNDTNLHLALADTLYGLHHYREAVGELQTALKTSPNTGAIYAQLARSYAQLHERDKTLQNVQLAEQHAQADPQGQGAAFFSTGEALSLLGDTDAAMERFEKALTAANADRVGIRLAIARLMVSEGRWDDARRQIALGLMEARAGETTPPTGDEWIQTADVLLSLRDFQLAENYLKRASAAGASDTAVRVRLANTYLALGDTTRAAGEISSISSTPDAEPSYQYLLAKANVYLQQHQNAQALTAFAQAADAAGEDETAYRELLQVGGNEGLRVDRRFSFLADFSIAPIFEDTTVYPLDAKMDVPNPVPGRQGLLPLPRSSLETQWTGAYHLHLGFLPEASGFFQMRNARGQISLPSANAIVDRDTTDYSFNFGLNPTLHLGNNVFTFSTGFQRTIRRDSKDPFDMNQNLFRQFLYMSSSSFFNFVSVQGYAIHEAGPFIGRNLHSRDLSGALDFRVGRPWGKTALLTGWGARDEQFFPLIREFYYTSAYVGIQRKVSDQFSFKVIAEDLRAWRVEGIRFATAQALRPAANLQFAPTRNWSVQASVAYSRNMGFHQYDAVQSGFAISYAMPVRRMFKDEGGNDVLLRYPVRFSAGMQQESFLNFAGGSNQKFRPYVRITLF